MKITSRHVPARLASVFPLATAGTAQAADQCGGFEYSTRPGNDIHLVLRDDSGKTYSAGSPSRRAENLSDFAEGAIGQLGLGVYAD